MDMFSLDIVYMTVLIQYLITLAIHRGERGQGVRIPAVVGPPLLIAFAGNFWALSSRASIK